MEKVKGRAVFCNIDVASMRKSKGTLEEDKFAKTDAKFSWTYGV